MAAINGEAISPRAGVGAAFLIPQQGPNAISLLGAGQQAAARHAANEQARRDKADAQTAKDYHEDVKYDQDGSVYFAEPLNEKIYKPIPGQLQEIYKRRDLDQMGRQDIIRPIKQRANNETAQSKAKSAAIKDTLGGFQRDNALYNPQYAAEHLAKALRNEDGSRRLPSEFDEEAWRASLLGDANAYNEKEVVVRAAKGLFPVISQKIAEAGQLGGQHAADQVRGRLVAFDGKGHARLNADGTPVMNLTAATDNLLDSDPLFKLQTDKRVAAYEKARAENIEARKTDPAIPEMPAMTRRGHHATMLGPLAFYDQTHDEGLNAQVPRPRAAAASGGQISQFSENDVRPAEVGATVNARNPFADAVDVGDVQQNFYTSRHSGAPTILQKNGTRKPVQADALYSREVIQEDEQGRLTRITNNKTPMSGYYGEAHQLPVNPQTGEVAFPKNKQEEAAYLAKGYKPQTYISFYTEKGENYNADYRNVLADLTAGNMRQMADKRKSQSELDDTARKMASKGVSRKFVPYNAENAATVNNQAGDYYRLFHQGTVKGRTAAKPQRPAFLQPTTGKKTTTKPTNTNNAATDNSGGML